MTLNDLMKKIEELMESNAKLTAMLEEDLGMAACAKLTPEQMSSYVEKVTEPVDMGKLQMVPRKRRVQTKVRKSLYESDIIRIKQLMWLGYSTDHISKVTGFAPRTVRYVKSKARDYVLTRRAV